jgi:hypothetical protein
VTHFPGAGGEFGLLVAVPRTAVQAEFLRDIGKREERFVMILEIGKIFEAGDRDMLSRPEAAPAPLRCQSRDGAHVASECNREEPLRHLGC